MKFKPILFRAFLLAALYSLLATLSPAQGLVSTLEVQKSVKLGTLAVGTITPTQLTANTDDWAPTGFSTAFALRVSTDASRNLTGIAGGSVGRVITLENIGSFSLVLKNASSSSTAANRFALTRDYTLEAGSGVFLKYDATASRWAILGAQPAPAATGDTVGPSSSTDNAVARMDGTTGKLLQNSLLLLSDAGAFTFVAGVKQTFAPDATNSGLNVGSYAGVPSSLANGDLFYDSTANAMKARINGSTVSLGAGGGTPGGSDTYVQINSSGAFGGSANFTYASSVLGLINGLAANTSGDGFTVSNTTPATSGNQRYSPRVVLDGQGWKTTSTAASQDVRFAIEARPVQGTTNPTGNFVIGSNINAAGYTDRFTIDSAGVVYLGSTSAGKMSSASGSVDITAQGSNQNVTVTPSGTGFFRVNMTTGPGFVVQASQSTGYGSFRIYNDQNSGSRALEQGYAGSAYATPIVTGGPTGEAGYLTTTGAYPLLFGTNNNTRLYISGTGVVYVVPTTASSSTSTGAFVNAGGFGNAGALYNGGLLNVAGDLQLSKTITGSGTTGAQTINKNSGSVRFAAAASSLVVTDSLVGTNSVIICTVGSNDSTCKSVQAVAASGSFTIYPNAAPTAETIIYFHVTN